jgi:endonuclease/exonuclease/phosphatase family metal-dependent hydrolase
MNRILGAVAALLLSSACATAPVVSRTTDCVAADAVPAPYAAEDGSSAFDLEVLIYNVEGLPWPARFGRGRKLDRIGAHFRTLFENRRAPDIVMLQEVFSGRARRMVADLPYPTIVPGPSSGARRTLPAAEIPSEHRKGRRRMKGEKGPKLLGGGLYILSRFPVLDQRAEPFSRGVCAGFDCLSNKGVLMVRVAAPGLPTPIDFLTTHMNAQGASRVNLDRTHLAHAMQTDESVIALQEFRNDENPLIFGGDFNMRRAPGRLDHFVYKKPYHIVRHYCSVIVDDCDVAMSWDSDEPWLDTQDLQGFDDGEIVRVRPIRVEAMFDGPQTGGRLSDHDAYLVTYRISWPKTAGDGAFAPAAGGGVCLVGRPTTQLP